MKQNSLRLEDFLKDLKQNINPELKENEVKLDGLNIKVYNIQENFYITLEILEELLFEFMNIRKSDIIRDFIRDMVNTYKITEVDRNNVPIKIELCRIDHLTENIFALIDKKYEELKELEDASIFGRIEMSKNTCSEKMQENIDYEYPFDKSWEQEEFSNIMSNMYSANNFIETPNPEESLYGINKRNIGRGRSRIKQEDLKDRPFICEYPECKRAFKRFEHLKRHNKMHTGERPYKCKFPGCLKTFSRTDNLSQHFKIHNAGAKHQNLSFGNYYEINKD